MSIQHRVRARRLVIGSLSAVLIVSGLNTMAQTNKPARKSVSPPAKKSVSPSSQQNTKAASAGSRKAPGTSGGSKSADSRADKSGSSIPGLPPNMPVAAREMLDKQLRGPLEDRAARSLESAKQAGALLQRVDRTSLDHGAIEVLIRAGAKQVAALRYTDATKTFERAVALSEELAPPLSHRPSETPSALNPANVPDVAALDPTRLWSLEARLFLFDLALESELNAARADEVLQPASDWLQGLSSYEPAPRRTVVTLATPSVLPNQPLPLPALGPILPELSSIGDESNGAADSPPRNIEPREARQIAADVRLRSGLLFAIRGDAMRAKQQFQEAERLGFHGTTVAATCANRVLINQRNTPLPEPVRNGQADAATFIRLALVIEDGQELDRAIRLWDALLKWKSESITAPQRSFVYFHRAHARFRLANLLERDPKLIAKDYELAVQLYPLSDWADDALFLHANVEWNLNRDSDKAVTLWQRVLDKYPGSEHAERSAYYIGVSHETSQRWQQAQLAYHNAKQRFPNSQFNTLIDKQLKKVNSELSRAQPKK